MVLNVGGQDVSRETYERLEHFSALVKKWTARINLISPVTVDDIWDRHVVDSAQIYPLAPSEAQKWTDIGSGGGFPGIIVAILAGANHANTQVTLIESDQRKSTFLRTAIRELDLQATVVTSRIEDAAASGADVVSARALTSLSAMMPYLKHHLSPTGQALLHKGKRYQDEIAEARKSWSFDLEEQRSLTDPASRLLTIKGIHRVG